MTQIDSKTSIYIMLKVLLKHNRAHPKTIKKNLSDPLKTAKSMV